MFGLLDDDVKRVEPVKRLVGGRFGWAIHKYPIKNGKTMSETVWADWRQAIIVNVTKNNILFRRLTDGK